ncbi:MAG: LamG-like jellyroll fold domain-containing protein [Candidatus Micrarchaeia archaeon]
MEINDIKNNNKNKNNKKIIISINKSNIKIKRIKVKGSKEESLSNYKNKKERKEKNLKGILLTLLMVIFMILIVTEVIVYTMINMNYNNSMENLAVAQNQGSLIIQSKQQISSILQESLSRAYSIISIEYPNYSIESGSLSARISSLMENGTLNNINFNALMGTSMLSNINKTLNTGLNIKNSNINIKNSKLFIYQTTPFTINATYTGIINIQSGLQKFSYLFEENASININNTVDLSTAQRSNPSYMKILNIPKAIIIGNTIASSGSLSPYLFTYGTIINISGAPSCSNIPVIYQNSKFILATPNAINLQQNICNMGGLITYAPLSTTPTAPYLAYAPSSNILKYIKNGTEALLYGNALELINASPIINYLNNNYYFSSPYTPDYLNINSNETGNEGYGLSSFSSFYTTTPYFSDTASAPENIITSNNVILPSDYTISLWINKNYNMKACGTILAGLGTTTVPFELYADTSLGCSAGSADGEPLTFEYKNPSGITTSVESTLLPSNIWTYVAVVFSPNTITWYINGNKAGVYTGLTNPSISSNRISIGEGDQLFNGSIADIQIYNAPLPSASIAELYRGGILGKPITSSNLVLWMPLEGNANDYSNSNNNGIAQNIYYKRLRNYYSDSFFNTYNNNVTVAPLLNCYNMSACYNFSLPHTYFRNSALSTTSASNINANINSSENDALGLINVIIPKSVYLFGNSYINEINSISWMASNNQPYSFSLWVDPVSSNGIIIDEFGSSLHDSFLSLINGNVVVGYYNASGEVCANIGSIPLNKWSNIVFTYSGTNTLYGYINAAQTYYNANLAQRIAVASPYYMLGFYNTGTTYNCGTLADYKGLVADYQLYNAQLSQLQIDQLYINNFIPSVPPSLWMPLSGPAGAQQSMLINTTKELENNNYGLFELNGKPCSVGSILNYSCGISYIP